MDLRKKIVETAQRLAIADGLYNVSLEDVVNEAEITEETFYKFFKNLDELLTELVKTRFGLDDDELLKLPLEEKIKLFTVRIMTQVETATLKDYRNWIVVNCKPRENSELISDKKIMRKFLKSSIDVGELSSNAPVEDIVEFIVSLLYGLTLNWSITDAEFEPLEHMDIINDLILNSLIPYIIK